MSLFAHAGYGSRQDRGPVARMSQRFARQRQPLATSGVFVWALSAAPRELKRGSPAYRFAHAGYLDFRDAGRMRIRGRSATTLPATGSDFRTVPCAFHMTINI